MSEGNKGNNYNI